MANPIEAFKNYLKVRPIGCKTKSTIVMDMEGFQSIMVKIPEKDLDNLVKQLTERECEIAIDYLHRYMQFISDS